jgi:hypothetical protein
MPQPSTDDAIRLHALRQRFGIQSAPSVGPCDGCRHADRCSDGLACVALELFANTGRFSASAPRQPSRDIFKRLYPEAAAV